MIETLNFHQVNNVIESWMQLQAVPKYSEQAGVILFRKLFKICPAVLPIFSFGKDTVVDDEFLKSPRFRTHANVLLRTFSGTVDMLGPNLEDMRDTLVALGRKHKRYGVNKEYFEYMGIALLETVQELLTESFTAEQKLCWEQCWEVMINMMVEGLED
ncbi:unnamed protein product [Cylindrotheca closterium]|uniref:Globin domain-containing protein n=1 Tax=Cylindrotheca closterium TaxID=2856 RepID=A0AAD2GB57_9STRA|nr:unnamed protein product [Cylindrotheca closterium]